jgi:hypothetical protein
LLQVRDRPIDPASDKDTTLGIALAVLGAYLSATPLPSSVAIVLHDLSSRFVIPLVVNWVNELPSKLNPVAFTLNLRRRVWTWCATLPLALIHPLAFQLHIRHQCEKCVFVHSHREHYGHVFIDLRYMIHRAACSDAAATISSVVDVHWQQLHRQHVFVHHHQH